MPRKKAVRKTKTKTKKEATTKLGNALSMVDTVFKGDDVVVALDHQSLSTSIPHLPTGALAIDYLIGGRPNSHGVAPCPGLPKGRILNLYGHEGSGKTTLALTTVAQVCAAGGTACYIDFENAIVPDYAAAIGVPITETEKFVLLSPQTLEDGLKVMYIMLSEGVDLIVIDSVGAGVPKSEFEKDIKSIGEKHARVGEVARIWSGHLPKMKQLAAKRDSTIIAISQIRANISTMGYGDNTTVQGGNAWKFYSALRMKLRRVQQVKGKVFNAISGKYEDQTIGSKTRAKLDKCKVSSAQGQEIDFHLRQGEGIDNASTLIDIASNHGIIKKSGSWMTWFRESGDIKVQGSEKMRSKLKEDPNLFDELWSICIPLLSGSVMGEENNTTVMEDTEEEGLDYSKEELLKDIASLD